MPDLTAILTVIIVALVYLAILRGMDMNEKEPLWALSLLLLCGGVAGACLNWFVPTALLELSPVPSALVHELARLLAIFAGMFALTAIGVKRGASEIDGVMDGLVYGGAGGLGLAIGRMVVPVDMQAPEFTEVSQVVEASWLVGLGRTALVDFAHGIFGALIGAGLAALLIRNKDRLRLLYPFAGYVAAVAAHLIYQWARQDHALDGQMALVWAWASMLAPALLVGIVAAVELRRERRAIAELSGEPGVTPRDLELLRRPLSRQVVYLRTLLRRELALWSTLKQLHNRQVQLALAKTRGAADEAEQLRGAIDELRQRMVRAVAGAASKVVDDVEEEGGS